MGLFMQLKSLFILQLLIGFVFVVSGLIINFIQLCTCVLWPFNKQLYRRINCRLAYSLWSREYSLRLVCASACELEQVRDETENVSVCVYERESE